MRNIILAILLLGQVTTKGYVDTQVQAATTIILYTGLSVQGTHLASGATETGTLSVAGVKAATSCTQTPASGTLPPVGLQVICSTTDGVITITRRNETTDPIDTPTQSYNGAVLQ
jgi:hypothetical protein